MPRPTRATWSLHPTPDTEMPESHLLETSVSYLSPLRCEGFVGRVMVTCSTGVRAAGAER